MPLLTADAKGVFPIAPTPFLDDGTIDTASIDRLTDFYLPAAALASRCWASSAKRPSSSMPSRWRWRRA